KWLDGILQLVELRAHYEIALAERRIVEDVERLVLATHEIDDLLRRGVLEKMRHARRGKAHEIAGPDFGHLAVDLRRAMAGDDVDPFLLEKVRVIDERVLARRQADAIDVGALHTGEPRHVGAVVERVRTEPLREGPFAAVELRFPP